MTLDRREMKEPHRHDEGRVTLRPWCAVCEGRSGFGRPCPACGPFVETNTEEEGNDERDDDE